MREQLDGLREARADAVQGAPAAGRAPDWLADLNPEQREAVVHLNGPLLVLAGAGSGKTRVLTYRVAYLLAQGVPPEGILAVTFTNKAAREMRERVSALVGPAAERVWVGTFHATCVQILRRHADRIGFPRQFLIFDTADQQAAVTQALKDLNLDPKRYDPRSIRSAISAAKNELVDPEGFSERAADPFGHVAARVYRRYQELLRENGAFDFDDLIMMTVRLFREHPDVLEAYQRRFLYIMVDEYQDTNRAQYVLVNALAAGHRNLCVVGDADQSIYAFRGADIRNILDFQRDYPDARVIRLERNYRSTGVILEAANQVIENNRDRLEKRLWTDNEPGPPIVLYRAPTEREEAAFVADEVERLRREEGHSYGDIALLYRTHAQSRAFEETFIRRGVPYRIVAGTRFYERREIKDVLAYLRAVANPADAFSLRRIINVPKRGIGDQTVARLEQGAARLNLTLYEAMAHPDVLADLGAGAARKVNEFREMMEGLRALAEQGRSLTRIVEAVLTETGYLRELEAERTLEAQARVENVKELITVAAQFEAEQGGGLLEFLEQVALVSDVDAWDEGADAVALLTVHAAKGLEFPVVFMVGMEEGVFPHSRSLWETVDLEEERRLCYVAMTRARRRLYMTCARVRSLMGATTHRPPSRFIDEISPHLIQVVSAPDPEPWASDRWPPERRASDRWPSDRWDADEWDRWESDRWDRWEPEPWRGKPARGDGTGSRAQEPWAARLGAGPGPAGARAGGARAELRTGHRAGAQADAPAEATAEARPQPRPAASFRPGQKVRHPKWGEGTVIASEPSGDDAMVTVAFDGEGIKKLMASIARLEPL